MTEKVISKLEEAYSWDATDLEATLHAGIALTALYQYQRKNPEFKQRKEQLKKLVTLHAKRNIHSGVVVQNDSASSKWVLERRAKEDYSTQINNNQRFVDKNDEDLHEKDLQVLREMGWITED